MFAFAFVVSGNEGEEVEVGELMILDADDEDPEEGTGETGSSE